MHTVIIGVLAATSAAAAPSDDSGAGAMKEFLASVIQFASAPDCAADAEVCVGERDTMLRGVADRARRFLDASPQLHAKVNAKLHDGRLTKTEAAEANTHLQNFDRLAAVSIRFADAMHSVVTAHTMEQVQTRTKAASTIRAEFLDAIKVASLDYSSSH